MQTLGRFCLLVALHSVLGFYHRFLRLAIFFLMDFPSTFRFIAQASEVGCGFVLLGYYSRIFNLIGIFLIFIFSIRFLRYTNILSEFGLQPKSPLPPKAQPLEQSTPKISSRKKGLNHEDNGLEEKEESVEDEVFDIMALRKLVKFERQRFSAACAEIEKERVAASSAAEEAMAMILRLQSEKSSIEIQANQFRRMVDQKQEYDLEVIESLRWTIQQHESQKRLLEDQLEVYREKLRQFMSDDEIDQLDGSDNTRGGFLDFSIEYDPDHACSETDILSGLVSSQG